MSTSPYLELPKRSEEEARRASETWYFIKTQIGTKSGKPRPYFTETGFLDKPMTECEGYQALREDDDALAIYEVTPKGKDYIMRDVSESMARIWLSNFDGERDDLPAFIESHLSEDEINAHFDEIEASRRYARELSSPEFQNGRHL